MEIVTVHLLWANLEVVDVATPILAETLKTRPILSCAFILFKWGPLLLGYADFDIGNHVLAAVCAMNSSDSIEFVIYMALAILVCTHVYKSVPLELSDFEASGRFG